jgi:hypothetical protein
LEPDSARQQIRGLALVAAVVLVIVTVRYLLTLV